MANKRLLDFPALSNPNGDSILYVGNQADSFRESKTTINELFAAYSAGLASIAGLTTAADQMLYLTGVDTYDVTALTAAGRNLLDDASTNDMLVTLGAVPLAGGTMTGLLNLSGDAVNALNPVSLQQLQAAIQNVHPVCLAASYGTDSLSTWTYDNGAGTLTAPANGSQSFDGVTPADGDSIFVIDQASNLIWQGPYTVAQGDGSNPCVLTRRADFDQAAEMQAGDKFTIVSGTNYGGHTFMFTQTAAIIVGTTDLTFDDITNAGAGTVTSVSGAGLASGTVTTSGNITVTASDQTAQEAGSSNSVAVTPGVQQYHQSAAKCWLLGAHSGGTPVIAGSYGVSSLTDSGTGLVTVNLSVTFSSANWAALWTGGLNSAGTFWCNAAQSSRTTTTTVAQMSGLDNNVYDVQLFTMAGFGDLS